MLLWATHLTTFYLHVSHVLHAPTCSPGPPGRLSFSCVARSRSESTSLTAFALNQPSSSCPGGGAGGAPIGRRPALLTFTHMGQVSHVPRDLAGMLLLAQCRAADALNRAATATFKWAGRGGGGEGGSAGRRGQIKSFLKCPELLAVTTTTGGGEERRGEVKEEVRTRLT